MDTTPAFGATVRRAVRCTVAASAGFYGGLYGLGRPVVALYALFTVVALGVMSEVTGSPARRTRTLLAAAAVGAVLVCLGSLLAASLTAAVVGILVLGFLAGYAGTAGPRVAGVAGGVLLLAVLPCFPPFDPAALPERLAGLAVGVTLLVTVDRLLLPAPMPVQVARRVELLCSEVAIVTAELASALRGGGGEPTRRRVLLDYAQDVRLARLAATDRPLGPGRRDRALLATATALRAAADRAVAVAGRRGPPPDPAAADLVGRCARYLLATARMLGAPRSAPSAELGPLDDALRRYRVDDLPRAAGPADLRRALAVAELAEHTRTAVLAAECWAGTPTPAGPVPPALWFLDASPAALCRERLRTHLTVRSVYLQNAVRLALGLAAARLVAGTLDLSHGFWVLLATLSLMRTSTSAERPVLLRAFIGTVAGAVVAGTLLLVLGDRPVVYSWLLPVVMLTTLTVGPLLGVAAAQAGFTILVAVLFAQLDPVSWRLAEVRLTDVLVGGTVGAVIGVLVWPRGGGGEIRRVCAQALRAVADEAVGLVAALTGTGPPPAVRPRPAADPDAGPGSPLTAAAALLGHAYVQYRTEPMPESAEEPDWLILLLCVQRIDAHDSALRADVLATDSRGAATGSALSVAAAQVARAYRDTATALAVGSPLPAPTGAHPPTLPSGGRRQAEAWGWLRILVEELETVRRATAPAGTEVAAASPPPIRGP